MRGNRLAADFTDADPIGVIGTKSALIGAVLSGGGWLLHRGEIAQRLRREVGA